MPGAALHLSPPASDMRGNAGLEKLMGWLCGSTVTIDLRSRHSTKRMHAVQGYGILPTSSLTRGPGAALASHPGPLTCGHAGLEKLMGWLCGSKLR
jgi:hypothetical protein